MITRVGIGYDIHQLVKARQLVLGGVHIPYSKGLLGHSDADCLIHAVIDALLGAAKLRDIGRLFPDTDPAYKDISSIALLKQVYKLLSSRKFRVCNIDSVIVAQEPKILKFRSQMEKNIASALRIPVACVSVKAKTNEHLDSVGAGLAIACHAVALVGSAKKRGI